jgi:hypothetical protein
VWDVNRGNGWREIGDERVPGDRHRIKKGGARCGKGFKG